MKGQTKMKLKTLFLSFVFCLIAPCFAKNYQDVYTDENGVTYAVKLDSIVDMEDIFYQLRIAGYSVYRVNGENLDEHFISLYYSYLYDCGSNQMKFLFSTPKRTKGVNESFWHFGRYNYNDWTEVRKEKDKKVLQFVCQYDKINSKK